MYLANKGYKVANVPLVKGIDPPQELNDIDPSKVVGLLVSPRRLAEIRTSRLVNMGQSMKSKYADLEQVEDEITFCRKYYRQHPGWLIIDVTSKSVEESASEILRRLTGKFLD
jgi:regulator of PEP synthase PpsR (kinase-PPPase family)